MDLGLTKITKEKIMLSNIIEIGRCLIMTGPLLVWPILTLVLEDRRKKGSRS